MCSCWNGNLSKGEARRGRAWAECGRSFPRARARLTSMRIPLLSSRSLRSRLSHPSGYRPQGYLFVASEDRHVEYLRANLALQTEEGLSTARLVTREEVGDLVPQLKLDGVKGGSFCSTDGFVDPHSVMTGFMQAAIRSGGPAGAKCAGYGVGFRRERNRGGGDSDGTN